MRLHIAVAGTAYAALVIVSPACGPRPSIAPATPRLGATGRIISVSVHSPSLESNLLGDPADQRVDIYLPPSYEREPGRRFAAIYLLHGILGTPDDFTKPTFQRMTVQGAMDTLINTGRAPEMIVVVPNGRNKYGGSYYTNSTVTGNWEDYLVRDVVGYVDRTYRTIAQRDSRGIAGHSMGGYAARRVRRQQSGNTGPRESPERRSAVRAPSARVEVCE